MKKNAGFTLIELLVVVLIIGILSSIALPQYEVAVAKSRFVGLLTAGKAIADAENLYYLANNQYTDQFADLDFGPEGTLSSSGNEVVFGNVICRMYNSRLTEYNCQYMDNPQVPVLIKGFTDPFFYCRVYNNNKVAEKVCLSMGGEKTGCKEGENFCQYKMVK